MREPCDLGHELCEGPSLHIRARDAKGCAQFQDGSWLTKNWGVCFGPHLGLNGEPRPFGDGDRTLDWLEGVFAANRRPQ